MSHIHNFKSSSKDHRLLKEHLVPASSDSSNVEYENVVVKKPWGYEYLAFDNHQVAVWVLHIARKRKTSIHCHPKKTTGLIVLSGNVVCSNLNNGIELHRNEAVEIGKGCFHSTEATSDSAIFPSSENGIWLLEIEAPSNKTDLIRIADSYGRQGEKYEGNSNLIPYRHQRLKLEVPKNRGSCSYSFMGSTIVVHNGHYESSVEPNCESVTVSVIEVLGSNRIKGLTVGRLYPIQKFIKLVRNKNIDNYVFLTIRREPKQMKLSDYVASFIAKLGVKHVFSVCGGGAMHLVDSFGNHDDLQYIAMHHEQAASMAAEAYARISNKPGVALLTTGPGGTNALTGVAGAWIDSIPTIFISGQVTRDTLSAGTGLRQFGIQESNICELVKSITKYSVTITRVEDIRYELEKAAAIAVSGRPGPVWIDIPLDIQSQFIDITGFRSYNSNYKNQQLKINVIRTAESILRRIENAQRPVLLCGYGVRLAHAQDDFRELVERLNVPVVTSWTASDLISSAHKNSLGRCGIFGDRASNFAVQNADLLLIVGSRMSIPQVGYNFNTFARDAEIIMVDVDEAEMHKSSIKVDIKISADAKDFIVALNTRLNESPKTTHHSWWNNRCAQWKLKYPVVLPEYSVVKEKVNSFYFIETLSNWLDKDAIIITDMGTSFTCTMQTFKIKLGQRLTTSSGHASMGFGLPGSIGACFANANKKIICITGEGGLQMNLQELQTVVHHSLPIVLFVLNNGGYLSIKHMQQNHFGRCVGSDQNSGISFPNLKKLADAYDLSYASIRTHEELNTSLKDIVVHDGPIICEVFMAEDQPLIPRLSSTRRPDGTVISKPIEDLYPFLDRQEFNENMIVSPIEEFE